MKANWYKLPLPQYRHYGSGLLKDTNPWRAVTPAEIEQWRARDLADRWATEPGIAQCLTWLDREFGRSA